MTVVEIKELCERVSAYGLNIRVRLKKDERIFAGKIKETSAQYLVFHDDKSAQEISVPYSVVANIRPC